jgi:SOS-response transcriptional repressor LexA
MKSTKKYEKGYNNMSVHEQLRQRRKELGLSISEVSKQTDVSISHISRIESGERVPGYDVYEKLSNYYGQKVPLKPLLKETDEQKKIPVFKDLNTGSVFYAETGEVEFFWQIPSNTGCEADFGLRMPDGGMSGFNIKKNDIVFIKSGAVENGEIAAVFVDGAVTVRQIAEKDGIITLIPRGRDREYIPQIYGNRANEPQIIGKAVSIYADINY